MFARNYFCNCSSISWPKILSVDYGWRFKVKNKGILLILLHAAWRFLSWSHSWVLMYILISIIVLITARKRSLRRLCFYRCLSVHRGGVHGCRGAYMVARAHVWLLGGMHGFLGGMHGCQGVCMVAGGMRGCRGGHAWLLRGMHGCWVERVWLWGACVAARGHAWVKGVVGMHGKGGCMTKGGHAWKRGGHVWDTTIWRYNQWTGSTHPTGMHSCLSFPFSIF